MVFKKSFFRIGMWNSRLPPPFMEKTILNFHFDYLNPSLSPKPDYSAYVFLWLEFLKNCPRGRAEVFCPFDWHVRSRALRGSLRERRRGRQKLAPNFAFCFWQKCLFCSQQARVILHKVTANQDSCFFIQVMENCSKPNHIWTIS